MIQKAAYMFIVLFITSAGSVNDIRRTAAFQQFPDDIILKNYGPPKKYFNIKEGSCGEACLWSILSNKNISTSQKKINIAGGSPGRGLHSNELFTVLKRFNIRYRRIPGRVRDYRHHLNTNIIGTLKKGSPVLLGVKVYPDVTPAWACDHFILVVGFNRVKKELIYNSFNRRYRLKFSKLLNTKKGYSLVSQHKYVFAIAF